MGLSEEALELGAGCGGMRVLVELAQDAPARRAVRQSVRGAFGAVQSGRCHVQVGSSVDACGCVGRRRLPIGGTQRGRHGDPAGECERYSVCASVRH